MTATQAHFLHLPRKDRLQLRESDDMDEDDLMWKDVACLRGPAAIHALTFHVRSSVEVNVMMPVAAVALLPGCQWDRRSWPEKRYDPCHVLRFISKRGIEIYKDSRPYGLPQEGLCRSRGRSR